MGECIIPRRGTPTWDSRSRLPEGYTEVDYIQSSGTQYINLNKIPSGRVDLDLDFELVGGASSSWRGFFGARTSSGNTNNLSMWWTNSAMTYGLDYAGAGLPFSGRSISSGTIYNFKIINREAFENGVSLGTSPNTLVSSGRTMYLFWANTADGPYGKISMKLYKFIWSDGTTTYFNLVPCINQQNEVGMYDLVSQSFFGNSGSGTFTAGSPV